MSTPISRRDFVRTGAAAGVAAALPVPLAGAPAVIVRSAARPVVIASGNGNHIRNGGRMAAVETAFTRMTAGADVLDAIIAGVNLNELDPADTSVGYGGLPNAEGVVSLDASVMHGPRRRAGAVAALEGVRTPSLVARAVMENTDHLANPLAIPALAPLGGVGDLACLLAMLVAVLGAIVRHTGLMIRRDPAGRRVGRRGLPLTLGVVATFVVSGALTTDDAPLSSNLISAAAILLGIGSVVVVGSRLARD